MNFKEWNAKQQQIWGQFRAAKEIVRRDGIKCDPAVEKQLGGYLIVLRHSLEFNQAIAGLSRLIDGLVPTCVYTTSDVHTTFSDYQVVSESVQPEEKTLKALGEIVKDVMRVQPLTGIAYFTYNEILWNQTTVVATGATPSHFFMLADLLQDRARKKGIELRLPWSSHVTVARFTERMEPDQLDPLFNLLEGGINLPPDQPEAVVVSSFRVQERRFRLTEHSRNELIRG